MAVNPAQAAPPRNGRSRLVLACGLACAWLCLGCGKSHSPDANVPEDCRKWLDAYFDALKAKDVARIQGLCSVVSAKTAADLPAGSAEMMRASQKETTAGLLKRIEQDLGDFRAYSVGYCSEDVITNGDPAANIFGEGRHLEILCETKYSKRKANEVFVLFKGPLDAGFIVQAHRLNYSPF